MSDCRHTLAYYHMAGQTSSTAGAFAFAGRSLFVLKRALRLNSFGEVGVRDYCLHGADYLPNCRRGNELGSQHFSG